MEWALAGLAIVVLGFAAVAGAGRLGGMRPVVDDTPSPALPDGELRASDLRTARFAVVTRGYSMGQVDALLNRLARQLESNAVDERSQPAVHSEGRGPDAPAPE